VTGVTGPREALDAADALLAIGRYDTARRQVVEVLAGSPENARALRLLARCHQDAGDYPAMLAAAESAVAAEPDDPTGHLLRGSALLQLNRPAEAAQAAGTVLALAPHSWSARLLRGLALVDVPGQRRAAFAEIRHAIRIAPHEPHPQYVLGTLYHALGSRNRARQAYRRILRLDPQHAGAQQGLGHLALRAGRATAAVRYFSAAAAADPGSPGAVGRLERVLMGGTGLAMLVAFGTAMALVFTAYPVAWAVAAGFAGLYALWAVRFWRALSPGTRGLATARLRRDPRLLTRLGGAAALLVAGLAAGVYRAPFTRDGPSDAVLVLMLGLTGLLLAAACAALIVDARRARTADHTDAAGPEEHGEARIGRLLLRWYLAVALAAVPVTVTVLRRDGDAIRALAGLTGLAALLAYIRWSARRWRRHPAPALPLGLLPVSRGASGAAGLLVLYLPAAAFLPFGAADLLTAPALVLIGGALAGAAFQVARATIKRLRRGATSRVPSTRPPAA
jgi:tetratricopeptide (TPR) repeat protein